MKNIFLTLSLLGCAGFASAWLAPEVMKWHEETVQVSPRAMADNLVKDSGFDKADFSKNYNDKPLIYDEWITYKDENSDPTVSFAVIDDAVQGKVASCTGKAKSYYTSFFTQRIKTVAKKGIYKLSFLGKSPDGGQAKIFIPASKANGDDSGLYFIKSKGIPTNPDQKWYGNFYNPILTNEWKEYSETFDLTKIVQGGMYGIYLKDIKDATTEDLENFRILFQGSLADKTILIDDVKFELIEDLSGPEEPEEPVDPDGGFIKDAGFNHTDLSKLYSTKPYIYNEWVVTRGTETTGDNPAVAIAMADDAEQGKVFSFTGKASSYASTFLAQRIDTVLKKGIYKISFWGKTVDGTGAAVKIFFPASKEDGSDSGNYFIRKGSKPTGENVSYGNFYNIGTTGEWKEYSCEFDFTSTVNTMYGFKLDNVHPVTEVDLTNVSIRLQGSAADKTVLIDNVKFELVEDLSEPEEPVDPDLPDSPIELGENVLLDSGFDATTDLSYNIDKGESGVWLTLKSTDEKKDAKIELRDEPTQGKVVAFYDRASSYYTTFMLQRIDKTLPTGIYRLSFKGRSDNNGQVKIYFNTVDENKQGMQFVKETDRPSDPNKLWYGCWQSFYFTNEWKEYYVDFNLSMVMNSMYQWSFSMGRVRNASATARSNINIAILGNGDLATALIDDVKFCKIADVDDGDLDLIVRHDFEEPQIPAVWKATGSTISLSDEHRMSGGKSLCWDATDKATLELDFGGNLQLNDRNAAKFDIYSTQVTNNKILVEFLDAKNNTLKKATLLTNFKGWREFYRSYKEYADKEAVRACKLRFTYQSEEGAGQKIYLDHLDCNLAPNDKRCYPDMMAPDVDQLEKGSSYLLKLYSYTLDVTPGEPTAKEVADWETVKSKCRRTPAANNGRIREILDKVANMHIVRNADGSVKGDPFPASTELTQDYVRQLGLDVENLSASTSAQAVNAFNLLVDHIIDQGLLYRTTQITHSAYNRMIDNYLNAMDKYSEEQRIEIIKAAQWVSEFGIAYAPLDYMHTCLDSDYITSYLPNIFSAATHIPNVKEAVSATKHLSMFLANASDYAPGGRDILKPDGTGFHHGSHYNGYMYSYTAWVNHLYLFKGTCFQIDKEAYARIRKAVVSIFSMATKSPDGTRITSNSFCGRHPFAGTGVNCSLNAMKQLVEIGGEIMGTGIDEELAAYYNYFSMTNAYDGVEKITPDGFYQFNYSGAGLYRQNNWVATMRCPNTRFWGSEIYVTTNRFGRYQSHGSLEIMYDGSWDYSGFPDRSDNTENLTGGWDWNVVPGATTVHYTKWLDMTPGKVINTRFDQYSKTTNFTGSLPWGNCGIFGAEFDQGENSGLFDMTNLTFKKSVYAFDGLLISLGSNIGTSGVYDDDRITATNLFQGITSGASGSLTINGEKMKLNAEPKIIDSTEDMWLVTPQGTGYFVPKGNDQVVIKHGKQSSPNQTGKNIDDPKTVSAAKAYINHGIKTPDKKYVFVAVPATNPTAMAQLATKMGNNGGEIFEIKAQNEKLHALTYKPAGVTAYSIFKAAEELDYGYLKSTASEMLLMEKFDTAKNMLSLAVCNPNLRPENHPVYYWVATPTVTSFVVKGEWKLNVNVEGVTLTVQADKTTKIELTLKDGFPVYLDLIDKDAAGIENVNASDEVKVYTAGHDVYVVNAIGSVRVYNVAGQFIKSLDTDGTIHFTLNEQGCYIIKVNNKAVKVMIK